MFKHGKQLAALALTALLCLPVVAYAEKEISVYTVDGINVYEAPDEFTVEIPAEVDVYPTKNRETFTIKGTLQACHNLEVSIKSTNGYVLEHEDDNTVKLPYSISDEQVVFYKDENATDAAAEYSYDIDIRVMDTATMSGTYTDTLTFTLTPKKYADIPGKKVLEFNTGLTEEQAKLDNLVISTNHKYVTPNEAYGMLPIPRRDGYTFMGWYTDETYSTEVDETTIAGDENTIVYAKWKAHTLTINYHNDGADYIHWESGDQEIKENEDVSSWQSETYGTKFSNGVSGLYDVWRWKKAGYTAKSSVWKIGKDGIAEYNDHIGFTNAEDCAEYLGVLDDFKEGDVTVELYPIWIANIYTVKYNNNAGSISGTVTGTTKNSEHTYDELQSLTQNGYKCKGYTFKGWNTKADGTGDSYTDEQLVENLTTTDKGTVTLYAQWELTATADESGDVEDPADLLDPVDDVDDVDDEVTTPDTSDKKTTADGKTSAKTETDTKTKK